MENKITFREAAEDMERLCDQIDDLEGDQIGVLVQELLKRSQENLADSVDRRISFIRYCESQEAKAREMRNVWETRLRKFEKLQEKIRLDTLATMKANPGISFSGTDEKFRVQKNSQPKLIHPLSVHKEQFEVVEIDSFTTLMHEYVLEKTVYILDKEALKKDLKSGKNITGSSLEIGEHIRIGMK